MTKRKPSRPATSGSFQKGNCHRFTAKDPTAALPPITDDSGVDKSVALLTHLAGQGIRDDDLRRVCGIPRADWPEHKRANPAIQDAIDAGRAKMHDSLVAVLYRNAKRGQLVPALFLLKTQFGYRENDPVDNDGSARVSIVIQIPGAQPAGTLVEGQRINFGDEDDGEPLSLEQHPAPLNGDPQEQEVAPESRAKAASPSPPNGRAARDFENATGISIRRSSFPSEAAYQRFLKTR